MEEENVEQEILLEPEYAVISPVTSVNGKIGDVVLTTSDLENDSDYQTGSQVQNAIQTAIAGKQDILTAGNGININAQNTISVDTTVVATQQNLSDEVTNRENADNALQSQIDAISASSDVVDIVGTYAELQNYDTSGLGDNDIIKVLQDSTQNDATTYYRWSTTTQTFTLIGQEGPYYTKASADAQFVPQTRTVNGKPLSANITLNASDVSALSPSDVDTQLANSTNPVQNKVLYGLLGDMPSDFFSGEASDTQTGTDITIGEAIGLTDLKMFGDTEQASYTGKNLVDYLDSSLYLANSASANVGTDSVTVTKTSDTMYAWCMYKLTADETNSLLGKTITASYNKASSANVTSGIAVFWVASGSALTLGAQITSNYNTTTGEQSFSFDIPSTIPDDTKPQIALLFYPDRTNTTAASSATMTISNLQLEVGSTATSYEPFVGGVPAPNPDFPQEIQTVTGEQVLTTRGKNLFNFAGWSTYPTIPTGDISNATLNEMLPNGVIVTGNTSTASVPSANSKGWFRPAFHSNTSQFRAYVSTTTNITVSADVTLLQLGVEANMRIYLDGTDYYTPDVNHALTLNQTVKISQTFQNVPAGTYFPIFTLASNKVKIENIQIEVGSTATSYEPYQSDTYTIDLGSIELCKIGDYQDYIYKGSDGWYLHKEINNVVAEGTSGAYNSGSNWYYLSFNAIGAPQPVNNGRIISTHFEESTSSYMGSSSHLQENGLCAINGNTHAVFRNTQYNTTAGYQDWLSSAKPSFYYVIATPTDTKITDQTLIDGLNSALNMTCYDGGTNIVVTSTNLPGELELTSANKTLGGIIALLRG